MAIKFCNSLKTEPTDSTNVRIPATVLKGWLVPQSAQTVVNFTCILPHAIMLFNIPDIACRASDARRHFATHL